jgi:hypothetical protein
VVSDLLDHGLVKVAGIALEGITDVKGVLQAREGLVCERNGALSQLEALSLALLVCVLNPHVMVAGSGMVNMVLELDDVRVWDGLGIDGAEDGSGLVVDCADAERGSAGDSRHREGESGLHGDERRNDEAEGTKLVFGLPATQRQKINGQIDVLDRLNRWNQTRSILQRMGREMMDMDEMMKGRRSDGGSTWGR